MKTHIGPIYLILGLMAVAAVTIGAGEAQDLSRAQGKQAQATLPAPHPMLSFAGRVDKARIFQATSPGMAMPARMVVLVSDKLDDQVEKRIADALAEARSRRKAG